MPGLASTEHLKEKPAPRASCKEQQSEAARTLWDGALPPRPPQLCPVRAASQRASPASLSQSGVITQSFEEGYQDACKLAISLPKGWPEVQIPGNVGQEVLVL